MVGTSDVVEVMSLKQKIIAYFEANPDEELTRADMHDKFGGSIKTLDIHLCALKKSGYLDKPIVYRRAKYEQASHD